MCKAKNITFAQVLASACAAGLRVAHHKGDGVYFVPSATTADTGYIVVLGSAGPVCSCPAPVGTCWHGVRAQQLAGQDAAARTAAEIAKGDAALADSCGRSTLAA